LLRNDVSFDPETIEAMHSAYEQVCAVLGVKAKDDRITELVAIKIIEAAKAGERNPTTMRVSALFELGLMRNDPQRWCVGAREARQRDR
jgi:hypothetical protein